MTDIAQELMTPNEAAKWFRRSPSWLRQQHDLMRVGGPGGQPLYHVQVCRAYVLGKLISLPAADLKRVQVEALAAACGIPPAEVRARQLAARPAAASDSDTERGMVAASV
ncbi:MAG: hypothetical protein AB7Q17_03690 [Phycisphaerae bacterium]